MKRLFICIFALIIAVTLTNSFAIADTTEKMSRLTDNGGLLDTYERAELLSRLNESSERYSMDMVIVTEESIGYSDPEDYADDFFDYNGFGFGDGRDGILLLVSMEYRDWHISTSGRAMTTFTEYGLEYLGDAVMEHLSDGEYYEAFETFIDLSSELIEFEKENGPYDRDDRPAVPFGISILSVIIGVIVSVIAVLIMSSKHKTVRSKAQANDYLVRDSFILKEKKDQFLYFTLRRVPRENNSSSGGSHRSSSGRSHGGRGGKF